MRKLPELSPWQSISDAATYLSERLEDVTPAKVLQLGMEGHLIISVHFPNGKDAIEVKLIPYSEANRYFDPFKPKERFSEHGMYLLETPRQKRDEYAELTIPRILSDSIVYDLPLIGAEYTDLKRAHSIATDGPEIKQMYKEGTFVKNSDGKLYCLAEEKFQPEYKVVPVMGLGDESVLVVRTEALDNFVKIHNSNQKAAQTENARSERAKEAEENKRIIREKYEELKKSNPNITKNKVADIIHEEGLTSLSSRDTIRKRLQKF